MKSPEMLQNSGRVLAGTLMESAIKTANSPPQAASQLSVLYSAGVSILAHHVYNMERQHGVSQIEVVNEVMADLRREMMLMNSATGEEIKLEVTPNE